MPKKQWFRVSEIENMLDLVQEVLPISSPEWDSIAEKHSETFPEQNRTGDTLKRKFCKICLRTPPTGNPNCPAYVKRAKDIRDMIVGKTDGSTGGSDLDDDVIENEEDEE